MKPVEPVAPMEPMEPIVRSGAAAHAGALLGSCLAASAPRRHATRPLPPFDAHVAR